MMNRLAFLILSLFLALFLALPAYADTLSEDTAMKADGFGPILPGMKPSAIMQLSGLTLAVDKDAGGSQHCYYMVFTGDEAVEGLNLMVENDRLTAFTVYNPKIVNAEKIGIGTDVDTIKKAYNGLWHERQNPFGEAGDDDIIVTVSAHFGYVFYISDKKVNYYSAGSLRSIQKIEGCS